MNSKKIIRTSIVIALAAVSAVSCVTNKKVAYLQDMKHETQIELEDKFEAVIVPYDELDVMITSFDSELARPFNLRSTNSANYSMRTASSRKNPCCRSYPIETAGENQGFARFRWLYQRSFRTGSFPQLQNFLFGR